MGKIFVTLLYSLQPRVLITGSEIILLLLGIKDDLFKRYFLINMTNSSEELESFFAKAYLISVVIQDFDIHFSRIDILISKGGCVAFFGIYGEFEAPRHIRRDFRMGQDTNVSLLTCATVYTIGNAVKHHGYSKGNLVKVLTEDRLMVPKGIPLKEYVSETCCSNKEHCEDENYSTIGKLAKYCQDLGEQSPLFIHALQFYRRCHCISRIYQWRQKYSKDREGSIIQNQNSMQTKRGYYHSYNLQKCGQDTMYKCMYKCRDFLHKNYSVEIYQVVCRDIPSGDEVSVVHLASSPFSFIKIHRNIVC